MKKIFSLLAVAATAVVMTGCMDMLQALGDVLTDDPMFTCNSTVYDGQSFDVLLVKGEKGEGGSVQGRHIVAALHLGGNLHPAAQGVEA